jgi:hypothetical protein
MNTQELKQFDESYKWWGDFLEARKEALHAMKRLGFSYKDMHDQLNFNWEGQVEMILSCDKSKHEETE